MNRRLITIATFIAIASASAKAYGKLNVTVLAAGTKVRVSIVGEIWGGGWSESDFRYQMETAKRNGATDVEVYINSIGGDCFAANEMVNIINDFIADTGGKVTGRGGALVASAGTFIAVHLPSFSMAKNGNFMIHKPTGRIVGNADEIEKSVKLLRNLEDQYADAYATKTGMSAEDVKALYATGDHWMTAKEAKEKKFIDSVDGEEAITEETAAMYAACGRTVEVTARAATNQPSNNTTTIDMELKLMAVALGLVATATEEQVTAEIKRLRDAEAELRGLKAAKASADVSAKTTRIEAEIADAITTKRIHADAKNYFTSQLAAAENLDEAIAKFRTDNPPVRSLNETTTPAPAGGGAAPVATGERANWSLNDWMEKDVKGLRAMHINNYEAYNALYKAEHHVDAPKARA